MPELTGMALLKRAALFAAWIALGFIAWTPLERPFTRAFCAATNVVVGPWTFGRGGHVRLEYAPNPTARSREGSEESPSWNARLHLSIAGVPKEHAVRVNPRRLAYLPLVLLVALTIALPLTSRALQWCLGLGVPALCATALASVWITGAWFFGRVPGLVYDQNWLEQRALHFAYEALVTPLGNRLILPLFIVTLATRASSFRASAQPVLRSLASPARR